MATDRLKDTFTSVYNDDFRDSDNYHRLLFNSGRALQARELTQMQTIIQKEMERFGSNIFNAGACVVPGGANVDNQYSFIKLNTTTNLLPADYATTVVGTFFTGATSDIKFKVIEVVPAESSDPATLYVSYVGGSSGAITNLVATPGENVSNGSVTLTVQSINTVANPATGFGTRVMTGEGSYFVFGHFVFAPAAQLIVSKYTQTYTGVVGFKAEETIITASDEVALYDNTGTSPNLTSPGADRYKIALTLIDQADIQSGETFVWAARIVNGSLEAKATGFNDYNIIEDFIAQRTSEESGDYLAKPFSLSFRLNADDATNIDYNLSPGTAYINGYRADKPAATVISVPKATTTSTLNEDVIGANYGNYFLVSDIKGSPNINEFETLNLRDAVDYGGSTVGTARVRHVERTGSTYKYYLMDINMSGSNNLRNTKSIGSSTTSYANFTLTNGKNEAFDTFNNNLLFPLARIRPSHLTNISYTYQKRFPATTNTNDSAQLSSSLLDANERWADTNLWTVTFDSAGEDVSTTVSITGSGTEVANLTSVGSLGVSKDISVLAYVNRGVGGTATLREKTLTTTNVTDTVDSDGNGVRFVDLGKADIFDILAVRKNDASGEDYSSLFTLDNGQRDNFYTEGRLILNNNYSVPSGNIYAQFRYFSHSPTGSFFAQPSYSGIDYNDIPTYRQADGQVIQLSDVLDFRSVKDETGSNFTGAGSKVHPLPRSTDTINADITYYEPRRDKVVISEDNVVSVLQGEPDFNPQFPLTPSNALNLFEVELNPNTLNDSDLTITKIRNKRYTMKDIDELNNRLEDLRETTALSLLELDTKNLNVVDSNGALRTKAGFLVDNFKDYTFSDIQATDYRATIDINDNVIRPQEQLQDVSLVFDSNDANSVNFKVNNGVITLDYTEVDYINQPIASRAENVNPFSVTKQEGRLTISPTSDVFYETVYAPAIYTTGRTQRRTTRNRNNAGTRTISTILSDVILEDQTGELPYMRSRKIYFKAERLKPNQRMFAFFDQLPVADWVREEDFKNISQDEEVYGNTLTNASAHPEGATTLSTDEFGTVEGSFVLPSTESLKFTTGTKQFELLNVSAYDKSAATAFTNHNFTSEGFIETRQQTIRNTRIVTTFEREDGGDGGNDGGGGPDPLAQTFIVEETDGVFVTGVNVYFASVDTGNEVVYVELRPVVNGIPSAYETIPGSLSIKKPSECTVVPSATEASMLANPTKFSFQNPIYLNGQTEYAIVVSTNSTEYTVYTAKTDEFVLGTTEKRVNKQPSTGSLFKSSNMRTWTPTQDQDLTYKLERAEFVTSGSALLENARNPKYLLEKDPFFFDSGESTVRVFHPGHGFRENDTVHFFGLDSATTYGGVLGTSILDSDRPVIKYDATGYTFAADSAALATTRSGGSNITVLNNLQFDQFIPNIQNLVPSSTSLKGSAKFTTGQSIAGSETRFQKDASFNPIKVNEVNFRDAPGLVSFEAQEELELGDRSVDIKLEMSTTNSKLSPVIDLHRANLITSTFVIDKQVDSDEYQTLLLSDVGPLGENVPITYVAETAAREGSHAAKHVTVPVSLAAPASGLKILLAANRPSESSFEVYYRTATSDQVLADQTFTLVEQEESVTSDANREVFREYTYLAGGTGGTLNSFVEFQVKIVFRSTNSSKVPSIRDLRIIALVD